MHWKSMDLKDLQLEAEILNNLTLIGTNDECSPTGIDGEIADYRKGATGANNNIYIKNFTEGKDIELDKDDDANSYT